MLRKLCGCRGGDEIERVECPRAEEYRHRNYLFFLRGRGILLTLAFPLWPYRLNDQNGLHRKVRAVVEVLDMNSYLGEEGAGVPESIADEPSEEGS